jgi:hypothetical protein
MSGPGNNTLKVILMVTLRLTSISLCLQNVNQIPKMILRLSTSIFSFYQIFFMKTKEEGIISKITVYSGLYCYDDSPLISRGIGCLHKEILLLSSPGS